MKVQLIGSGGAAERVTFEITPNISESQAVNYSPIESLHLPTNITVFRNTPGRVFNVSDAKLVARTQEEADEKIRILNLIRGWSKPRFSTPAAGPPDVLLLKGYGRRMLKGIPVVLTNYVIDLPPTTDYIKSSTNEMVPILSSVTLTLNEVHSMAEINSFTLSKYKTGTLRNW